MLVLDALDCGLRGAIWQRTQELRQTETVFKTAAILGMEFEIDLSHRSIVRWININEQADAAVHRARIKQTERIERSMSQSKAG